MDVIDAEVVAELRDMVQRDEAVRAEITRLVRELQTPLVTQSFSGRTFKGKVKIGSVQAE